MIQADRSFTGGIFIFVKEPPVASFIGTLDSGVSNEAMPSDRCPPEDMLSEFRGKDVGLLVRKPWYR